LPLLWLDEPMTNDIFIITMFRKIYECCTREKTGRWNNYAELFFLPATKGGDYSTSGLAAAILEFRCRMSANSRRKTSVAGTREIIIVDLKIIQHLNLYASIN
jgi:hypothetical protein